MEDTHPSRRYDLDWLRVIAFAILILYHTGMMFNTWAWHIKNNVTSEALDYVMMFSNQWRMPLLFFISGAAVWFALSRYSIGQFVTERHMRLLLPLLFGMLVIIPPQVYFERLFQGQAFASFGDFYKTIFEFKPYPEGNLSWHHLWYIPYIFVFSLIALPAFHTLRSAKGREWLAKIFAPFENNQRILLWFIPLALSEIALRPLWPDNANNLLGDWAQFTSMLIVFCCGYALASQISIWATIEKIRFQALACGMAAFACLYAIWLSDHKISSFEYPFYQALRSFNIWCWILTLLGFARRYLGFNSPALKYANEAVYPFYILHQTITVILGFHLAAWPVSIPIKFFVVAAGTFGACWAIYEILIKRSNLMRMFFGLKARNAPSRLQPLSRKPRFSKEPRVLTARSTASEKAKDIFTERR